MFWSDLLLFVLLWEEDLRVFSISRWKFYIYFKLRIFYYYTEKFLMSGFESGHYPKSIRAPDGFFDNTLFWIKIRNRQRFGLGLDDLEFPNQTG